MPALDKNLEKDRMDNIYRFNHLSTRPIQFWQNLLFLFKLGPGGLNRVYLIPQLYFLPPNPIWTKKEEYQQNFTGHVMWLERLILIIISPTVFNLNDVIRRFLLRNHNFASSNL